MDNDGSRAALSILRALQHTGYVLNVAVDRREALLNAIEYEDFVAEVVPAFDHSRNKPMLCFLSFETDYVTHLAIGKKGSLAATDVRTLKLEEVFELEDYVYYDEIARRAEPHLRKRVRNKLEDGGTLAPASFNAVVEAVWDLSPSARPYVSKFREARLVAIASMPPQARESLGYQKEAVATAVKIAGIDKDVLQDWRPTAQPTSFLSGLQNVRVREDAIVAADLNQIPGFDVIQRYQYAAVTFRNQETKLTVVLANHLPLEQQTGADLIYYNHVYESFVAVQYKMMQHNAQDGTFFRLPDEQLSIELSRMEDILKLLEDAPGCDTRDGFRLHENPFFLKFCSRIIFNPDDESLVSGMYFPLDFWNRISGDEALVGPRGGRQVDFRNAGRYFDNTEFITLVSRAWVGTTPAQSAILSPLIEQVLQEGRAVIIASAEAANAFTQYPSHSRRR